MRSLLTVLVALGVAECTRGPSEDFHQPSVAAPSGSPLPVAPPEPPSNGADPSARCVTQTPSTLPSPVPAGPAPGCPIDPEAHPPSVEVVRTTFPETGGVAVDAELVSTDHDTTRGLMYRRNLAEDKGMLFNLHLRTDHKFWMHNTCIPLDLLFVDDDGLIVGIVENAPTLNDEARSVGCPSRWVLEVNAGWSRRHGVKAGQHMTLP